MIEHAWSVLCSQAIIDKISNNLVLQTVERVVFQYESQDVAGRLVIPINGTIVTMWYKEQGDEESQFEHRVLISDFEGTQVGQFEGTAAIVTGLHARTLTRFDRLPAPPEGRGHYHFDIQIRRHGRWHRVARIPLYLEVAPQQTGS